MRMFMQNIINNQRSQTSHTYVSRTRRTRPLFSFNSGYNTIQSSPPPPSPPITTQNNSNTIIEPLPESDASANIIQYQLFNTNISVRVNNLTSELENSFNPNRYYSTFEYESFNIRFFHNELLDVQNIDNYVDNVLNNINEIEIHNLLNNLQHTEQQTQTENTPEIVNKISKHTVHDKYVHCASTLKNHTCPILLNDFEDDDIVSIFILCNHAIDESAYDRYTKTFTKCPLCNHKLFE